MSLAASHHRRQEEDDVAAEDTHTDMVVVAAPHPDLAAVDPAQLIIDQTQELVALRVMNARLTAEKEEAEQMAQRFCDKNTKLTGLLKESLQANSAHQAAQQEMYGTVDGLVKVADSLGNAVGQHIRPVDARAVLNASATPPLDSDYCHRKFILGYANSTHPGLYMLITFLTAMLLAIKPEYAGSLLFYKTIAPMVAAVIYFAVPSWLWPFACIAVLLTKIRTGSRWATDALGSILPGAPKYTELLNWMKKYVAHKKSKASLIRTQEDVLFQFDNWGRYVTKTARAGFVYCQNAALCTVSEAYIFGDSYLQLRVLLAPVHWAVKLADLAVDFYKVGLDLTVLRTEAVEYVRAQFQFIQKCAPLVRGGVAVAAPMRLEVTSDLKFTCRSCGIESVLPSEGNLGKKLNVCPCCQAPRPTRSAFEKLKVVVTIYRQKLAARRVASGQPKLQSITVPHAVDTSRSPNAVPRAQHAMGSGSPATGWSSPKSQDIDRGTTRQTLPAQHFAPNRAGNINEIRRMYVPSTIISFPSPTVCAVRTDFSQWARWWALLLLSLEPRSCGSGFLWAVISALFARNRSSRIGSYLSWALATRRWLC